MKQQLIELQEEIEIHNMVKDINTLLLIIDRISQQKISKKNPQIF